MGITHVIRGDDHLTNAARQTQIFKALGWTTPIYAHVPLIHGPDGAKLSKRHGALGVDAYRAMGYLPAALRNYLVRLGWSHGDQEIFSTPEMIEKFDLAQVGRAAARFDFAKLENMNGHYMRAADDAALCREFEDALPYLPNGKLILNKLNDATRAQLLQAMPGLKDRAKTLIELADSAMYLFADRPLPMDAKAEAILTPEVRARKAEMEALMRGDTAGPVAEPSNGGNGGGNGSAKAKPAASALTDEPPVIPAKLQGMDLGPACGQCGGMMQRTGSCYTCSSCGNNTGCG